METGDPGCLGVEDARARLVHPDAQHRAPLELVRGCAGVRIDNDLRGRASGADDRAAGRPAVLSVRTAKAGISPRTRQEASCVAAIGRKIQVALESEAVPF